MGKQNIQMSHQIAYGGTQRPEQSKHLDYSDLRMEMNQKMSVPQKKRLESMEVIK